MKALFLVIFLAIVLSKNANATCCGAPKAYVPIAICSTGGTQIPLPYFVCCQLIDKKGQDGWRNQWVPTSCKNADLRATCALGCRRTSPVYGTGSPIIGNCQYSHSTGKYCGY